LRVFLIIGISEKYYLIFNSSMLAIPPLERGAYSATIIRYEICSSCIYLSYHCIDNLSFEMQDISKYMFFMTYYS
jgi:hypothetical protein